MDHYRFHEDKYEALISKARDKGLMTSREGNVSITEEEMNKFPREYECAKEDLMEEVKGYSFYYYLYMR